MGTLISCFYFAYICFRKRDVIMSTQLFLTLIFYFLLFLFPHMGCQVGRK